MSRRGWPERLVRLYPERLRSRYADDLTGFLQAEWRERRSRRPRALAAIGFALYVARDVLRAHTRREGMGAPARWLDDLRRDSAYAARTLLRTPSFVVGVLSLALAIGTTTAVYSTVEWLLDRPAGGVHDPDRVVAVQVTEAARPELRPFGFSIPQYLELRHVQDAFVDIAAYGKLVGVLSSDGGAEQVVFEYVSGSYFGVLGVRPALGRPLHPEDDVEGAAPVLVLSHPFWRSRFGGDPAVVGSTVRINGRPVQVVGVTPAEFEGYNLDWNGPTSAWIPVHVAQAIGAGSLATNTGSFFRLLARLAPGVSLEVAREKAPRWLPLLPPLTATAFEPTTIVVTPAREMRIARRGPAQSFLGSLLLVSALILLAACFNTANFFLGRAVARSREWALRTALGATRARLLRQTLTEAMLLGGAAALAGAALGAGVAHVLSRATNVYLGMPTTAVALDTTGAIDVRLAALAAALGLAAALAFGLLPALLPARAPVSALKDPRPHWTWSGLRVTPRQAVLVLQVALAVALAVPAGLYARSFARVAAVDSGYGDPASVLLARVVPRGLSPEEGDRFHQALLERLNAAPEVVAAGIGWNPPFQQGVNSFRVPGDEDGIVRGGSTAASPRFFEALGVPVLAGREFSPSGEDFADGVVINREMAEALWPGEDPVGRPLIYGAVERRVIGVVAEDRCNDMLGPPAPCAWQPFPMGTSTGYLRIRTRGEPTRFVPALRSLVRELHPDVAVAEETALSTYLSRLSAPQRLSALASAALALFGIVLLAVGCASLFLSMVRDSLREIAIRMALGATHGRLTARILAHGLALTIVGAGVGLLAARSLQPRLAVELDGAPAADLLTFVAVPLLVILVGAISVGYSARVATRTEPMRHLQAE